MSRGGGEEGGGGVQGEEGCEAEKERKVEGEVEGGEGGGRGEGRGKGGQGEGRRRRKGDNRAYFSQIQPYSGQSTHEQYEVARIQFRPENKSYSHGVIAKFTIKRFDGNKFIWW